MHAHSCTFIMYYLIKENFLFTELAYVGAAKYNVKLEKVILKRIIKTSKTPEKLALNLIAPLLSEYEINNCTLYGNQQHKKEAVAENKRRAIRCKIDITNSLIKMFKTNGMYMLAFRISHDNR